MEKEKLLIYEHNGLSRDDITVIFIYFVILMLISIYTGYKSKKGTISEYFLAGRFITWLPVGASLFASNIGSEHFIGLSGSGAASGIAVGAFEFNACIILIVLGWLHLPVYIATAITTIPDYTIKRFGGKRIQLTLTCISMMFYILTKISVNIMSGLIFIEVAIGYNSIYSIVFIIIVSFVISLYGGLTSVIFTDCIQTFVMLVGAGIVMIIALIEVKGYKNLHSSYTKLIDDKCYSVPKDAWTMLRPWNSKTMPWLGFLFGQSMASISYWCSDQMMVQRVLASKNISHAKGSTIFAAFLKLTPTFLLVIPGMISRCLYDKIIGCETAETCMLSCGKTTSCSNYAYPFLIMKLLPSGLRGLMLVVLVASLITDLTSIFNSASSLFTCDLYKYIRPKARNRELMVASRIFVVFMVVISVLWVPIIERMQGGEIYMYIQSIAAHISPQMGVMILIGMLWTRANEKGAFYGLMSGLAVGIIRLVLDIVYPEPKCGDLIDVRPAVVKIHYMYMALISSLVTLIVTVIISYLTKEPEKDFLIRTTIWTLDEKSYTKEEIALLKLVKDENKLSESILSEKGNSQDSTTTKNKTIWKRILNCIIGEYVGIKQERKEAAAKYFKTISSINQTKFQKYILNIFAGIVIFMVLCLYTFFGINSKWPFF